MIQFSYTVMCLLYWQTHDCYLCCWCTAHVHSSRKSRPETKVQLRMALLLLHYDLSAQTIIVDSHFNFTQHSCFRPGPPNFGLLVNTKRTSPQPSTKHPSHPQHFDIFLPISSNNCLQCVHVTFLISCKACWFHWLPYISCWCCCLYSTSPLAWYEHTM